MYNERERKPGSVIVSEPSEADCVEEKKSRFKK